MPQSIAFEATVALGFAGAVVERHRHEAPLVICSQCLTAGRVVGLVRVVVAGLEPNRSVGEIEVP